MRHEIKQGSSLGTGIRKDGVYQVARKCGECDHYTHSFYVTCKGNCSLNDTIVWHNQLCDGFIARKLRFNSSKEKIEIVF